MMGIFVALEYSSNLVGANYCCSNFMYDCLKDPVSQFVRHFELSNRVMDVPVGDTGFPESCQN